jgi:hypothetical protein
MRDTSTIRTILTGAVLTVALWAGTAQAEEQFQGLAGVPAEAMSQNEMDTVQGRLFVNLSKPLGSEAVVAVLEPGDLLTLRLLEIGVGGAPSSDVNLLSIDLLGLSL